MGDLRDKFIEDYRIKGYDIISQDSLRYGGRTLLRKSANEGAFDTIYIYYYDGKATIDAMNECFLDYVDFFSHEQFGRADKGFFLCSDIDRKAFNTLKGAKIKNNLMRMRILPHILRRPYSNSTNNSASPVNKPFKKETVRETKILGIIPIKTEIEKTKISHTPNEIVDEKGTSVGGNINHAPTGLGLGGSVGKSEKTTTKFKPE